MYNYFLRSMMLLSGMLMGLFAVIVSLILDAPLRRINEKLIHTTIERKKEDMPFVVTYNTNFKRLIESIGDIDKDNFDSISPYTQNMEHALYVAKLQKGIVKKETKHHNCRNCGSNEFVENKCTYCDTEL